MTHGGISMTYGSVCSGIEAASVAWHPLGWRAAWLAEIEQFPSAVLKHHYPSVPNLGDMTKIARAILLGEVEAPDVLVGGTPCQAYSVAGLREGLNDERGQLTLSYVRLFDAIDYVRGRAGKQPAICVWENVPGVLSDKTNAFGCLLAGLAGEDVELVPPGKKWANAGCVFGPTRTVAWRILDAQYFGVAQRRRRVFVIASARKDFDPTTVLFEFDGMRRDSAPSREAGQNAAGTLASRTGAGGFPGTDEACSGYVQPVAQTLLAKANCSHAANVETYIADGRPADVADTLTRGNTRHVDEKTVLISGAEPIASTGDISHCLNAGGMGRQDFETETLITQPYAFQPRIGRNGRGDMGDIVNALTAQAGETGKGDAAPCVAYSIQAGALRTNPLSGPDGVGVQEGIAYTVEARAEVQAVCITGDVTHTLKAEGFDASEDGTGRGQPITVAFAQNSRDEVRLMGGDGGIVGALAAQPGMKQTCYVASGMAVRRLTPRECERLQGFPDDYTFIPTWNGWRKMDAGETPESCRAEGLEIKQNKKTGKWRVKDVDGPRYKALGNSMAVPCMAILGRRIHTELFGALL